MKRRIIALIFLFCFIGYNVSVCAEEFVYPNYADEFLGRDKHEKFNRKMFNFDKGLNKYFIKPVHIIWASILPQYAMDRIFGISYNIEFPIRLVSSLVQKDFHNAGNETKRFFINTTIGLAGMYDPARRYFHIGRSRDNMDKAFARRNIKPGAYFVAPVIAFTTVRGLFGRLFDMALNPTTYIGTPLLAVIKAGILINKTSYWQSIIKLVESNYADPYEITKTAFGIDGFIKKNNYDRVDVTSELWVNPSEYQNPTDGRTRELSVSAELVEKEQDNMLEMQIIEAKLGLSNVSIDPDIQLLNYCPQSPVVDSMRTSLFVLPDVNKSIWNELSLWNRSFANRLKMDSVNVVPGRDDYKFKFLLQKNKNAPLAILYPSTGDGVKASHPMMFAKMFYDAGYSVVIQGNPFQWEFVKSMPENYRPGLPARDALMMRETTIKIIDKLQTKYNCKFEDKVLLGTSLAALDLLFIAEQESKDNTLGNTQYIALCPPIDLMYSLRQVDAYTEEWKNFSDELKQKVAFTSAKLVNLYLIKKDIDFEVNHLPFDEDEAKLITSFLMHQKLSDIIFVLEKAPNNKPSGIYDTICKMGFEDYFNKYIMADPESVEKELEHGFGLVAISDYLENANNYKIYHTRNDYLVNTIQLKQLKRMAGGNMVILDNGSHMGFLYRPEFLLDLQKTIIEMRNGSL